jgi:hypothetical protein
MGKKDIVLSELWERGYDVRKELEELQGHD